MIIRMNGQILEREQQAADQIIIKVCGEVVEHQEIRVEEFSAAKASAWSKIPLKWKFAMAAAAATLVIDILASGGSITSAAVVPASKAAAAGGFDINMVKVAVDPVKEFLIALADPICYVMFVWGCIECIVGRASSGLNRIKYAALGFIAINWIPMVMEIIRAAGAAGRGA